MVESIIQAAPGKLYHGRLLPQLTRWYKKQGMFDKAYAVVHEEDGVTLHHGAPFAVS